jgi:hypothetical protein
MAIVMKFGRRDGSIDTAICEATDNVGDLVYIQGGLPNGQLTVSRADPKDNSKFPAVGIIISKSTAELCRVQWKGETPPLFVGLDEGEIYFLGENGGLARIPPAVSSGGYCFVQAVGIATADDKIRINIDSTPTRRIG